MIGGEVDAGGRRRQRTDSGRTGLEFLLCDKYTVYNRIFINIILSMLYKYNHIDAFVNVFLESFGERKF